MTSPAHQEILAVQNRWLEYELDGNMAGVLSLCVEDVAYARQERSGHLWGLRESIPAHWQVAVVAWSNSTAGD